MLEKAAAIQRFEYSPLRNELKKNWHCKKQADIEKEQNQGLDKVYGFNNTVVNKRRENSDLVYNNFNYSKFSISDEEFNVFSDDTKHKHLQKLFNKIKNSGR